MVLVRSEGERRLRERSTRFCFVGESNEGLYEIMLCMGRVLRE